MAGKSADADIKCTDFGLSVYFKPGQKFKEVVGSGEGQRGQGGDEREGGCLEEAICWDMGEGCLMRHSHTHHTHTRPPPPPQPTTSRLRCCARATAPRPTSGPAVSSSTSCSAACRPSGASRRRRSSSRSWT